MNTNATVAKKHNWGVAGAIIAAIAASLCCIGPLVLVLLGVSGAWIGGLTALEPFRPYLSAVTLGLLGLAFYRVYRKPKEEACAPGSACANPKTRRGTKITLWVASILVVGLLLSPYVLPRVYADGGATAGLRGETATLAVDNMSCDACSVTIRAALMRLDGVISATITLDPPMATTIYDPSRVTVDELIKTTTDIGYPSRIASDS